MESDLLIGYLRFKGEHCYGILPQIHNLSYLVAMNCKRDEKKNTNKDFRH